MQRIEKILVIFKISIIVFSGIIIISSVQPYYDYDAPYFNAVASINLSNGVYTFSNIFLEETGRDEFVGANWIKTDQNEIIPRTGPRASIFGSVAYAIGDESGLLYVTPIFLVVFLILSERISTKFFGKYVGLLTVLFLATSNLIFRNSIRLQSDIIFSVFVLLGVFLLINFFNNRKNWYILSASSMLVFASIIRVNGAIFFPIEFILIIGYYVINRKKISKKHIFISFLFLLIPWVIFGIGYTMYNQYFFGDPFTNYMKESNRQTYSSDINELIKFENQDFENLNDYAVYLLPYQFSAIYNEKIQEKNQLHDGDILGIIFLGFLFLILFYSKLRNRKQIEIITLTIFILGVIWFHASITSEDRATHGVEGRYMIPIFIFSMMIVGFFMLEILNNLKNKNYVLFKKTKIIMTILITLFFLISFYFNPSVQLIISGEFKISNPEKIFEKYPLDNEGLNENSIVITNFSDPVLEYGFVPFKIKEEGVIKSESVELLKNLILNKSEVYIFKIPFNEDEKKLIFDLQKNYNFVFKEHSKSFCKVFINNNENMVNGSDEICTKLNSYK